MIKLPKLCLTSHPLSWQTQTTEGPFLLEKNSGSAHRIYVNLTYLPDDSSLSVVIGKEMNCYDDRKKNRDLNL